MLQVLKANCPVLVEHMVHSSISLVGGEAFSLLLKRPWNPAVGMHSMDKQVKVTVKGIFSIVRFLSCQVAVIDTVIP